jgi:hypothetical protein
VLETIIGAKEVMGMERTPRPRGTDSAKIVLVIKTKALSGSGTEDDPCTIKTQYWDLDGKLLAEI